MGRSAALIDGDIVRVVIDTRTLDGSIDLIDGDTPADVVLASRSMRPDLAPDPALPDATRIWAALQQVSGGTWGGCVYDADAMVRSCGPDQETTPESSPDQEKDSGVVAELRRGAVAGGTRGRTSGLLRGDGVQRGFQVEERQRLAQVAVHACRQATFLVAFHGVGGERDDRQRLPV